MSDLIERLKRVPYKTAIGDEGFDGCVIDIHQMVADRKESAAEITRLTEALAASEAEESRLAEINKKHCEAVNTLLLENSRLSDHVIASEEARRAERAAVVREIVEKLRWRFNAIDDDGKLTWACREVEALATDADNTALDKLLREVQK